MKEMIFKKSKKFTLSDDGGVPTLKTEGGSILIDELVAQVWRAADNKNFEALYQQLNKMSPISTYLLERILFLLTSAGALETSGKEKGKKTASSISGPLVSVVVVNWNGLAHNEVCLNSVFNQTYQNLEVIFVDNHSTDGSVEQVRKSFKKTKIVGLDQNYGVGRGLNEGMKAARGKYIYLLNNDTELDPEAIAKVVEVAEKNPDVAFVGSELRFFYLRNFVNSLGNWVGPVGWGADCYIGYLDFGQFKNFREMMSVCLAAALVRRKDLDQIGLMDASFKMYYEDIDLCWRAQSLGYKILICPESVVYHKFGASTAKMGTIKLKFIVSNRMKFIFRNFQIGNFWNYFKSYLKEDAKALLRSVAKFDFAYFRAYLAAYWNLFWSLPRLVVERVSIQSKRKVADAEIFRLSPVFETLLPNGMPALTVEFIRDRYYQYLRRPTKIY